MTVSLAVAVGSIGFVNTATASFQGASATDIGAGLASTTQTVTIDAQSPNEDGGTDVYRINVSNMVERGATYEDATFVEVDEDGDTLESGPTYNATTNRISLTVSEGANDGDKKLSFAVEITYDTRDATPKRQMQYTAVKQYDTADSTSWKGSTNPQFQLYGGTDTVVNTSSATGGAAPVSHNLTFEMTGTMDAHQLVVETPGANYDSVTADDITYFTVGSTEVADQISSVSSNGDQLTITLNSDQVMEHADTVRLGISDATNPSESTTLHAAFSSEEDTARFETDGALTIGGSSGGSGDDSDDAGSGSGSTTTTTTEAPTNDGGGGGGGDSGGGGGSADTGGSGGGGGDSGGGGGSADTGGGGGSADTDDGGADVDDSDDSDDSNSAQTSTTSTTTSTATEEVAAFESNDAAETTPATTSTTTTAADSPGFGVIASLVAVLAAALLLYRRE